MHAWQDPLVVAGRLHLRLEWTEAALAHYDLERWEKPAEAESASGEAMKGGRARGRGGGWVGVGSVDGVQKCKMS